MIPMAREPASIACARWRPRPVRRSYVATIQARGPRCVTRRRTTTEAFAPFTWVSASGLDQVPEPGYPRLRSQPPSPGHCTMLWKPALNAFAIAFEGRIHKKHEHTMAAVAWAPLIFGSCKERRRTQH